MCYFSEQIENYAWGSRSKNNDTIIISEVTFNVVMKLLF
jgi:hypothetical protein